MMTRTYTKTFVHIRYGRVLWFFLALNLVGAAMFSRLTAVRVVQVRGVPDYDRPRVAKILAELEGVPYTRIHGHAIESEILREPSLVSAHFSRNPLGRAQLTVVRRKPVAVVGDALNLVIDKDGVIYDARGASNPDGVDDALYTLGLVKLTFDGAGPPTLLGFAGTWQAQRLAKLATEIKSLGPAGSVGIQVDSRGRVCLNIGAGRVVLGSSDDLERKLQVLNDRLKANPSELAEVEELNLTRPDIPAVVPKQLGISAQTQIPKEKDPGQ